MTDISIIKKDNISYNLKDTWARNNINSITTNINSITTEINSITTNYLSLSGGIVEGDIAIKDSRFLKGNTTTASDAFSSLTFRISDQNGHQINGLRAVQWPNGAIATELRSDNFLEGTTTNIVNNLRLITNLDGTQEITSSNPQAWRNMLGISTNGAWPIELGGTGVTSLNDIKTLLNIQEEPEWHSISNTSLFTGTIYYKKIGKFVYVSAQNIHLISVGDLGTIEASYRPVREVELSIVNGWPEYGLPVGALRIYGSGAMSIQIVRSSSTAHLNSGRNYFINEVYMAKG